ncbi:MAG: SpoIIE family protein phosphatase [Vicinamibacteria bacterium]|nr:SpoIIE family protein phosphatase [Vicinamibacteria bacterium]
MKLRTQLALAFFLLAVVPLVALTLLSHQSSQQALQKATEVEAAQMASEMGVRLARISADLDRRLAEAGGSEAMARYARGPSEGSREAALARLRTELGEAATLVESIEVVPEAPEPPAEPAAPAPEARHSKRPPPPPPPMPGVPGVPGVPAVAGVQAAAAVGPVAPPAPASFVLDLPEARISLNLEALGALAAAVEGRGQDPAAREQFQREIEAHVREIARVAEAARKKAVRQHQATEVQDEMTREANAAARVGEAEAARALREQAADAAARERELAADRESRQRRLAELQERLHRREQEMQRVLGREFDTEIRDKGGASHGRIRAQVKAAQLVRVALAPLHGSDDELAFAVDREGGLHTLKPEDEARVRELGLDAVARGEKTAGTAKDWVLAARPDPKSGLTFAVARPLAQPLSELRRATARNLALGLGLAVVAFLGILPLSRGLTRDLNALSAGAERVAAGDLATRVPVRSKNEVGRLAGQFNRMTEDLARRQHELVEKERLRKELELCRRIQEELLPHGALHFPFAEVKGVSIPAREVGGDFFDYFALPGGQAVILVGDVSGKGVGAALLMANVQATLRARLPLVKDLAELATALDEEIEKTTPAAVYLTLFLAILEPERRALRYVNAGHNTQFLLHGAGGFEELSSTGRPLGLLPGGGYEEREVSLQAGDCLFLFTDGLTEAENAEGEPFGAERLPELLASERTHGPDDILRVIEEAVRAHRGAVEAADDATMVALKVG